jgi:hypothetical protein
LTGKCISQSTCLPTSKDDLALFWCPHLGVIASPTGLTMTKECLYVILGEAENPDKRHINIITKNDFEIHFSSDLISFKTSDARHALHRLP